MTSKRLNIEDYLRVITRRKWLIFAITATCLAAGLTACFVIPKRYKANITIAAESQQIPGEYVRGVVTGSAQDRLSSLSQFVMSNVFLSQIIKLHGLDERQGREVGIEASVENLRRHLTITNMRDNFFTLSFVHEEPVTAQVVVTSVASLFIEENIKHRERLVAGASEFLVVELEHAKGELESRERAIAEFKRTYMGELPQQMEANLRALDRLQIQQLTVSENYVNRSERLSAIEKSLKEYDTNGSYRQDVDVGVVANSRRSSVIPLTRDNRLEELRRTLARLRATYKDNYPDVVHLRVEIEKLDKEPPEQAEGDQRSQNPLMVGGKKSIDPYKMELVRQKNELLSEIEALKDKQIRVSREIKEYEGRVERIPAHEQNLQILVRDYDNMQKNYQSLLDKMMNAKISQNLEKLQKGEKFRIIDPATIPQKPEYPNQVLILMGALFLGCSVGYGTAFALEYMSGVIWKTEEAESLLNLPVLASIPDFIHLYGNSSTKYLPHMSHDPQRHAKIPPPPLSGFDGTTSENSESPDIHYKYKGRKTFESTKQLFTQQQLAETAKLEMNLVAKWKPRSIVAEQYRVAATRLVLAGFKEKCTVVIVTSSLKGEGKTTTASNIGYVLARDLGKNTLLIDCDFKQPMLNAYMGMANKPGLAEAIYGDASLDACLHKSSNAPLWLLPSGRRDHQLVDLAKIPQIGIYIEELRKRFEFIVIDAPPILPMADMNLLAGVADMLVIVVRLGRTPQSVICEAIKTLKLSVKAGLILTGSIESGVPKYFQSYHGSYSEAGKGFQS